MGNFWPKKTKPRESPHRATGPLGHRASRASWASRATGPPGHQANRATEQASRAIGPPGQPGQLGQPGHWGQNRQFLKKKILAPGNRQLYSFGPRHLQRCANDDEGLGFYLLLGQHNNTSQDKKGMTIRNKPCFFPGFGSILGAKFTRRAGKQKKLTNNLFSYPHILSFCLVLFFFHFLFFCCVCSFLVFFIFIWFFLVFIGCFGSTESNQNN